MSRESGKTVPPDTHPGAEEGVSSGEGGFRTLVDRLPDCVTRYDRDLRLVYANAAALEAGDLPAGARIGLRPSELQPVSPTAREWEGVLREVLETGRHYAVEWERRLPDGGSGWVYVHLIPEPGSDGSSASVVVVGRDITDLKRAEDEAREREARVQHSQKLEAVARLAGGVAQDFTDVVAVIRENVGFLLAELRSGDARRPEVEAIRGAVDRATTLTQQLLAFSRRQAVQPRVVDLNTVVRDMRGVLQGLLGDRVELNLELRPGIEPVLVDPGQLEQVLLNLCMNAGDAMPAGGRVSIATTTIEGDASGAPPPTAAWIGRHVRLTVSDTGVGMPPRVLDHAVEPFFTTKEDRAGLGLATVYGMVKQAGGELTVASQTGEGTTVTIHLPPVEEDDPWEAVPTFADVVGGTETVLLVDDDPPLRRTTRRILEKGGYRVFDAESGVAALELVEQLRDALDLLITDVVMPGMSGPELAGRLRGQLGADLPVLYVSGYPDETIAPYGVLAPDVRFLAKPFTIPAMLGKVREALTVASR